jgi:hypothetical protein
MFTFLYFRQFFNGFLLKHDFSKKINSVNSEALNLHYIGIIDVEENYLAHLDKVEKKLA